MTRMNETGKNFGNEVHDDCDDDARTELNREGSPRVGNGPEEGKESVPDNQDDATADRSIERDTRE